MTDIKADKAVTAGRADDPPPAGASLAGAKISPDTLQAAAVVSHYYAQRVAPRGAAIAASPPPR